MNIAFKEDEKYISFIVSEYPDEYKSILESQFYSLEDGKYVKKFPNNIVNIEQVKVNFKNYAGRNVFTDGIYKRCSMGESIIIFYRYG